MSAKDLFHEAVKQALIRDGWSITDDPLIVRYGPTNLKADLGAERIIAAQRDAETSNSHFGAFVLESARLTPCGLDARNDRMRVAGSHVAQNQ